MNISDGAVRLFNNTSWTWSKNDQTWYEINLRGQSALQATEAEIRHFNHHQEKFQNPQKAKQKIADQITIEALQAKLVDQQKLVEKLYDDRNALYRDPGVGGTYRRQSTVDMAKSDLLESPASFSFDAASEDMQVVWSRNARMKFRISGQVSRVPGHLFHYLPQTVVADNWWHLCAQVGLTEELAHLFYYHPENGQESAVAKAKPVQRGPIITCQGDYID